MKIEMGTKMTVRSFPKNVSPQGGERKPDKDVVRSFLEGFHIPEVTHCNTIIVDDSSLATEVKPPTPKHSCKMVI